MIVGHEYYPGCVKYLTAQRLIELLSTVPIDTKIAVNAVGNLMLLTKDDAPHGYIDFLLEGEVILRGKENNP